MLNKRNLLSVLVLIPLVTCMVAKVTKVNVNAAPQAIRRFNCRTVRSAKYQLWTNPPGSGNARPLGRTGRLKHQLVQVDRLIKGSSGNYYRISRRGHSYGWLNSRALLKPRRYILPYTYTSQLYPLYAPNACEAASLKMALSVKGLACHTDLKTIIDDMPRNSNPNKGFKGNPYRESPGNTVWTIYPKPLAAYARKYDPQAADITGASKAELVREIKRGNARAFNGGGTIVKLVLMGSIY